MSDEPNTDAEGNVVPLRSKVVPRSYEAGEREAIRDDGEDLRVKDLIAKTDEALKARNFPEVARLALELEGSQRDQRIEVQGVDHLFRPLPPVDYVLAGLDICPGAPTLVAGPGYSAKTMVLQSMAISVAAGLPVWGCLTAKQGKVLHLDYEQGDRLTSERYQRLAAGQQLTPEDIGDRLQVACLPRMPLDVPAAEAELTRLCDGSILAIADSFRAAFPHVDENSSEARLPLDMLGRVSQATGCTFIVVHHARKPQQNAVGGVRASIRGTGALFDAAASVIFMEADKGKPVRLYHEKARTSGRTADDMLLRIADVDISGERVRGLTVSAEAAPTMQTLVAKADAELLNTLLNIVRRHPGEGTRALRDRSPAGTAKTSAALRRLMDEGSIVNRGTEKAAQFYVVEDPESEDV